MCRRRGDTPKALDGGGSAAVGGVTAISSLRKKRELLLLLLSGEFSQVAHDVCTRAANIGPKAQ